MAPVILRAEASCGNNHKNVYDLRIFVCAQVPITDYYQTFIPEHLDHKQMLV